MHRGSSQGQTSRPPRRFYARHSRHPDMASHEPQAARAAQLVCRRPELPNQVSQVLRAHLHKAVCAVRHRQRRTLRPSPDPPSPETRSLSQGLDHRPGDVPPVRDPQSPKAIRGLRPHRPEDTKCVKSGSQPAPASSRQRRKVRPARKDRALAIDVPQHNLLVRARGRKSYGLHPLLRQPSAF